MNTYPRIGALLVAVVGGCAGSKPTAVPLTPIAMGVPVDASSYEVTVDGNRGGRVLLRQGKAIRERAGGQLVEVAMDLDNRTSDRMFRLPVDQIWMSNLGKQSARLILVDRQPAPRAIEVAPGEKRSVELTFAPAQKVALQKLENGQVHWTLLIDGASEPIARTTPYVALRNETAIRERQMADTRNWDLPASDVFNNVRNQPDFFESTTSRQAAARRQQVLGPGLP